MKKNDIVNTPRFLHVTIDEIFDSYEEAVKEGYTNPTYYESQEWGVLGKTTGIHSMVFCAYRKQDDERL